MYTLLAALPLSAGWQGLGHGFMNQTYTQYEELLFAINLIQSGVQEEIDGQMKMSPYSREVAWLLKIGGRRVFYLFFFKYPKPKRKLF